MRVIGHRGAAGLAPENTLRSIKAAIRAGIDILEFDVRVTKDKKLILCHDESLERTCGIDKKIADIRLSEFSDIRTLEGDRIPTLDDVLAVSGKTRLFIEGKGANWARPLGTFVKKHNLQKQSCVISFNHSELYTFGQYCKDVPKYAVEHHNPFDAINAARLFGLEGIDLNYWILNPLAYWLAHKHKLDVAVYTVNKTWMASFLRIFYPAIALTTDFPNLMQFVRPKDLRVKSTKKIT